MPNSLRDTLRTVPSGSRRASTRTMTSPVSASSSRTELPCSCRWPLAASSRPLTGRSKAYILTQPPGGTVNSSPSPAGQLAPGGVLYGQLVAANPGVHRPGEAGREDIGHRHVHLHIFHPRIRGHVVGSDGDNDLASGRINDHLKRRAHSAPLSPGGGGLGDHGPGQTEREDERAADEARHGGSRCQCSPTAYRRLDKRQSRVAESRVRELPSS